MKTEVTLIIHSLKYVYDNPPNTPTDFHCFYWSKILIVGDQHSTDPKLGKV